MAAIFSFTFKEESKFLLRFERHENFSSLRKKKSFIRLGEQFHRGASCLLVAPFIGIRIPPIGFPRSCDTWIFYKGISGAITVSDVIRQVFQLVRKSVCKERSGFGKNGWLRFSIAMFRIFKRRMCIVLPKIKMEKSLFHSSYQLYS